MRDLFSKFLCQSSVFMLFTFKNSLISTLQQKKLMDVFISPLMPLWLKCIPSGVNLVEVMNESNLRSQNVPINQKIPSKGPNQTKKIEVQ